MLHSFWHRIHLSSYSDYANLVVDNLPSFLIRGPLCKKLYLTFMIFLFSGMVHQITSWQLHPDCKDYADIYFYCVNAAIVLLESGVSSLVSSPKTSSCEYTGEQDRQHHVPSGWRQLKICIARTLGYIWVFAIFFLVIPKFYYPRIHCMLHDQSSATKASNSTLNASGTIV